VGKELFGIIGRSNPADVSPDTGYIIEAVTLS
jgi:hypothetical protein